ncbi:C-type lectin domain family 2 member B-like [Eublepharis macularius]|uniref:C-type lectin domain family 2 member B-like n=1 Tax=Eublepharis macularius TaxID=481883 RepID=A0AA97KX75_EUBMA|nr:C-type lectin domain family 2 member B-like [Eublepharis macularius]
MEHECSVANGPDEKVPFKNGGSPENGPGISLEGLRLDIGGYSDAKEQNACRNFRRPYIIIGILSLSLAVSVFANIAQGVTKQPQAPAYPSDSCPHGWIKNEHSCYLFSDEQKDWNFSRRNCSLYGASLVTLDLKQERGFVKKKGQHGEYWIDLQRTTVEQLWKWQNGSLVTQFKIGGVGCCAYLSYDAISSTTCDNIRHWICKK